LLHRPIQPQQRDAKELADILKNEGLAPRRIAALERFIRDNPDSAALPQAYSSLVAVLAVVDHKKAFTVADEALAKLTDVGPRNSIYSAKFQLLSREKNDKGIRQLGAKVLREETNWQILQTAAQFDKNGSVALLEKAIAERQKVPGATARLRYDLLSWLYAQSLRQAKRNDEAVKIALPVVEQQRTSVADLGRAPSGDLTPAFIDGMRRSLANNCTELATTLEDAGEHQKALDYLAVADGAGDETIWGRVAVTEELRIRIYTALGQPDQALDRYARLYAARFDITVRDQIVDLARMAGRDPQSIFDRAREVRRAHAVAIKPFALQTLDRGTATLDTITAGSKVTLVNFFFPT
jgi:tetratricopeptide (TPR) repeat protein